MRFSRRPQFTLRAALFTACVLVAGCLGEVAPTNPFDPSTPVEKQAPGTISGHVVLAEAGASVAGGNVRLLDASDAPILDDSGQPRTSPINPEAGDGQGAGLGAFTFGGLRPGTYHLAFQVDPRFLAPAVPELRLGPGETRSTGTLVFNRVDVGNGRIHGQVRLSDAAAGPRTVKVWRRVGQGLQVVAEQKTDGEGAFDVTALPPGTYAVGAELTGFTPDFGFGLVLDNPGALTSDIALDGDSALVLHPATAVLIPNVQRQFGKYYTREREVPLNVLLFGNMQEMRLSTSASFVGEDGKDVGFQPYAASATAGLPDREGEFPLYAQFRLQQEGFTFTSDAYGTSVVRDATPPAIVELGIRGHAPASDGTVWIRESTATLAVDVAANDATSGVGEYAVVHDPDHLPADLDRVPLDLSDSPSGYVRFSKEVTLTPGEGKRTIWVLLKDRAGNAIDPVSLDVQVDATAPALEEPLVVTNANPRGELSERVATLKVKVPDACLPPNPSGTPGTCAVLMRAGTAPLSSANGWGAVAIDDHGLLTVPALAASGQPISFAVELMDAAGNVASFTTPIYVMKLTGQAGGRVLVQGYPDDSPQHGGITVALYDPAGPRTNPVATADTAPDGTFTLKTPVDGTNPTSSAIPAGHYVLTATRADLEPFETETDIREGTQLTLPAYRVAPARGNIVGKAVRADLAGTATGHGGIEITATRNGVIVGRTFTADDGAFSFPSPGLPVTTATERYDLLLSASGYVTRRLAGVEVHRSENTVLEPNSATPPQPTPIELSKLSGDFQFCAALTGPCVPTVHTKASRVRVKLLEDTGVDGIRAQARTAFEPDATTPAFAPYDAAGTLVDIAIPPNDAEGAVDVYLQATVAGTPGAVLHSTIVLDRTPPTVTAFTIDNGPEALWPGFTNAATVRATVSADAGSGDVSPLQGAFVAFASTAPTSVPSGATACLAGNGCTVPLAKDGTGQVIEGTQTAYAFACDLAGNCSSTPLSARIVYDATPPATTHGLSFAPSATWITQSGGEWYTRSTRLDVAIGTGTGKTAANSDVYDLATPPQLVPDVAAYRFGFREDLADAAWVSFPTHPKAAQSVTVAGPALTGEDGKFKVYAQFKDAAGNVTSVDQNPRWFNVTLDQTPPVVSFRLNSGAEWTTSATVNLDVQVAAGDAGPAKTMLVSKDGGLFASVDTRTLPLATGNTSWGLPAAAAPGGDGPYTVIARFVDVAGNTVDRSASIWLDRTPPSLKGLACTTCRVDGAGTISTNATNRQVTLDFSALDNSGRVASAKIAIDNGTAVTSTYTGTLVATLPDVDGAHRLDVSVLDSAGNESPVSPLNVVLDRTSPTGVSVAVEGAAQFTPVATINLQLAATDVRSGTTLDMQLSEDPTFSGAAWEPFQAQRTFTLSSTEGPKSIYLRVRDAAGNVANASTGITYDRTAPSGVSVDIEAGAISTNKTSVALTIAGTDTVTPAAKLRMIVSQDPTFAGASIESFKSAKTLTLSGGDGAKTVFVKVLDEAGNGTIASATIVLDTDKPTGERLVLTPAGSVATTSVVATLSVSGATQMCLAGAYVGAPADCSAGSSGWGSFTTSKSLTLTAGDGPKAITAVFRDGAGNLSSAVTDTVVLDQTPPAASGLSIVANGGAGFTASSLVTLALTSSGENTPEMQVTEDPTFSSAVWEPFQPQKAFVLSSTEGAKTLYLRVRDAAKNTASVNTGIVYDKSAPTGVGITLSGANVTTSGGRTYASAPAVTANFTGTDNLTSAANLRMMVSQDPGFAGATLVAFAATQAVTLAGADGPKTVYVKVVDEAGNGTVAAAPVVLDTSVPAAPSITLSSGTATKNTAVVATLLASGAVQMCLYGNFAGSPSDSCAAASTGWETYASTKSLTLTGADGTKTVTALFRNGARVTTSPVSATTLLDTVAPAGATLAANGGAAYTTTATIPLALGLAAAELSSGGSFEMQVSEDPTFAGATWESWTSQKAFTLSSTEGAKNLYYRVRDAAQNVSSATTSITYDRTPPSGVSLTISGTSGPPAVTVTTSGGQAYADGPAITLNLAASDNLTSAANLKMLVSQDDPNFSGATPIAFSATRALTLTGGNGPKIVYVKFVDQAGNAASAVATVVLDPAAPTGPSIALSSGPATNATAVTATLSAAGAVQMCLYGDFVGSVSAVTDKCKDTSTAWEAYDTAKSLTLTGGDGAKVVYALFRNAAHVTTAQVSDTTKLDTVAPAGATITANGGSVFTSTGTVPLALGLAAAELSGGGTFEMEVSEDSTFATSTWETYQPQKAFVLSSTEGAKTIYYRVRDAAHNVSSANASVTYDKSAPTGVSIALGGANVTTSGGQDYAKAPGVTATLAASDNLTSASNLKMLVSQDPNFAGATLATFATSQAVTLAGADGAKTVYFRVFDQAGNFTSASAGIVLNATMPNGLSLALSSGSITNTTSAVATLGATGATQMCLFGSFIGSPADSCAAASSGWEAYSTTKSLTLTSGDGTKTVNVLFRNSAGLTTSATTVSTTLDTTAPADGTLSSPAASATLTSAAVSFAWGAVSGAATYRLEISTSSSFTSPQTEAGLTGTSRTVSLGDASYYARVIAIDAAGNASAGSVVRQFSVDTTAPNAPTAAAIASPTSNNKPTISWSDESASGATSYRLTLDGTVINQAGTSYVPSTALADGSHSFVVAAKDAAGNLSGSSAVQVFTVDATAPATPSTVAVSPNPAATATVLLRWNAVADASAYTVEWDTSAAFNSANKQSSTTTGTSVTTGVLAENTWYWRVKASDTAANASAYSPADSFTVDLTAPANPALSSPANNAFRTSSTVSFAWAATTGAASYLFDLSTSAAFTTYERTELTLTTRSPTLPDGDWYWRVLAKDAAGNISPAASAEVRHLTVDTVAPGVPVLTAVTSPTSQRTPSLQWAAVTGASQYVVTLDGATSTVAGTSTTPSSLADGTHTWTVASQDAAGNTSATAPAQSFVVDGTAPNAPVLVAYTPDPSADNTPTVTWAAVSDATAYTVQWDTVPTFNGANFATATTSNTSYDLGPLTNTTWYWRVKAVDAVGNASAASTTDSFVVDTSSPSAPTPIAPANNATSTSATVSFSWSSVSDAVSYRLQLGTDSSLSTVVFDVPGLTGTSKSLTLGDNTYYWRVLSTDAAGNQTTSTSATVFKLTVDASAPATPVLAAVTTPSSNASPTFTWSNESGSGATAYILKIDSTNNTVSAPATSFTPSSPLAEASHTVSVASQDAAGNTSAFSTAVTFRVDQTPPTLPGSLSPAPNTSQASTTANFSWSAATDTVGPVGYVLQIARASDFATLVVNQTQTATTASVQLADGDYWWRVRSGDAALNTSNWVPSASGQKLTIDTTAPSAPDIVSVGSLVNATPTLKWASASGAAGYTVVIDDDSAFGSPITTRNTASTQTAATQPDGSKLPEGTWYWRVRAVDAVGNTSAWSSSDSFTLDTIAPSVPVTTAPSDGSQLASSAVTLSWGASTGSPTSYLGQIAYDTSFNVIAQSATVTGTSVTATLPDGTYAFRLAARDAAGNQSNFSSVIQFTVDTDPPRRPTPTTVPTWVNASQATFTIGWSDESESGAQTYRYDVASDSAFSSSIAGGIVSSTSVTLPRPSTDGQYYWRVRSRDALANASVWSATQTFGVDTVAPTQPVKKNPADAAQLALPVVGFTWLASTDANAVTYALQVGQENTFQNQVVVNVTLASGTTSSDQPLAAGTYYWRIRAVDAAGNVSQNWAPTDSPPWNTANARQVVVDLTAPDAPALLPFPAVTSSARPNFAWSPISDATQYDVVIDDDSDFSSPARTITLKNGTLRPNLVNSDYTGAGGPLADGAYYVRVFAYDAAGNRSQPSQTLQVTVDTTAPAAPSACDLKPYATYSFATNSAQPTFSWSAVTVGTTSDAAKFELERQLFSGGSYATNLIYKDIPPNGTNTVTYSLPASAPLANGSRYQFLVRAIDAAGNSSTSTICRTNAAASTDLRVDTTPPAAIGGAPTVSPASPTKSTSVTASWTRQADATSGGECGYTVKLLSDTGAVLQTQSIAWTSTTPGATPQSTTFTNLPSGRYVITVAAVDAATNEGPATGSSLFTVDLDAPRKPVLASPLGGKSAQRVSNRRPTFTWSDEAASGASSYAVSVYTADSSGNKGTQYSGSPFTVPGASSFQIPAANQLGDGYYYWTVQAIDLAGNSSGESDLGQGGSVPFFEVDTTAPAAVASRYAPAIGAAVRSHYLEFQFSPVLSGATDRAISYVVEAYDGSGNLAYTNTCTPSTGSKCFLSSLDNRIHLAAGDELAEGSYTWRVRAMDDVGNASAWFPSNGGNANTWPSTFTVDDTPPDIPGLQAPADGFATNSCTVSFTWDNMAASGATSYQLWVKKGSFAPNLYTTATSTYAPTFVSSCVGSWRWWVNAIDAAGNITASSPTAGFTIDQSSPPTPTLLTADGGNRSARLFWSAVTDTGSPPSGLASYTIHYNLVGSGAVTNVVVDPALTDYTVTGLVNKRAYQFTVTAEDKAGNASSASSQLQAAVGFERSTVPVNNGFSVKPVAVYANGDDLLVAYVEQDTLWTYPLANLKMAVSNDGGRTWTQKTVDGEFLTNRSVSQITLTGAGYYVLASTGGQQSADYQRGPVRTYYSTDRGRTWFTGYGTSDPTRFGYANGGIGVTAAGSRVMAFYSYGGDSSTVRLDDLYGTSGSFFSYNGFYSAASSSGQDTLTGLKACTTNYAQHVFWQDTSGSPSVTRIRAQTHQFLNDNVFDPADGNTTTVVSFTSPTAPPDEWNVACATRPNGGGLYLVTIAGANLIFSRSITGGTSWTNFGAVRTDADPAHAPAVWAGGENVYVTYRTNTSPPRLVLGESTNNGGSWTWSDLIPDATRVGYFPVATGSGTSDLVLAFVDDDGVNLGVLKPALPAVPLRPVPGVGSSLVNWADVDGAARYLVSHGTTTAVSTQSYTSTPPYTVTSNEYVTVQPVDDHGMPGNDGEMWQLAPFTESDVVAPATCSGATGTVNTAVAADGDLNVAVLQPPGIVRSGDLANVGYVYVSTNGGQSWTQTLPASTVTADVRTIGSSTGGRVFYFYRWTGDGKLYQRYMDNYTGAWGTFVNVDTTAVAGDGKLADDLSFAQDPTTSSRHFVAYSDRDLDTIGCAWSTDTGASYTLCPKTTIPNAATFTIQSVEAAYVRGSSAAIFWRQQDSAQNQRIYYIRTLNSGASWSAPAQVYLGDGTTQSVSVSTPLAAAGNGAFTVLGFASLYSFTSNPNLNVMISGPSLFGPGVTTDYSNNSDYVTRLGLDHDVISEYGVDAAATADGLYLAYTSSPPVNGTTTSRLMMAYCHSNCWSQGNWIKRALRTVSPPSFNANNYTSAVIGVSDTSRIYVSYRAEYPSCALRIARGGVLRRQR